MEQQLECRLCAKFTDRKDLIELFEPKQLELLHHVKVITTIRLEYIPDLPQHICLLCTTNLQSAIEFQNRCIESQKFFFSERYRKELQQRQGQERSCTDDVVLADITEESVIQDEEHKQDGDFVSITYTIEAVNTEDDFQLFEEAKNCSKESESTINNEEYIYSIVTEEEPPPRKKYKRPDADTVNMCDLCGAIFSFRGNLIQHVKRHKMDKKFQCGFCEKRFHSRQELHTHERTHTGEKPFTCKYCDRAFASRSSWYVHERLHNNDMPYLCRFCGSGYKCLKNLKRHEQTHTGEKPFECTICKMNFQRSSFLKTHYHSKIHQRNEIQLQLNATSNHYSESDESLD